MKHLVCYSGGHSSALTAIEVVRRYGKDSVTLLNHDIHPSVEVEDIKRFKREVAEFLDLPVTYANHAAWDKKDQFDVVREAGAFKVGTGTALCTHRLKTAPFETWLNTNARDSANWVIYYGFDSTEGTRILRRSSHLAALGYRSEYPLAFWPRTLLSTKEVGIEPPLTYSTFKHANCIGCLKAGRQHWYAVFCSRPDIWEKAKSTEDVIGYSIIKGVFLEELEPKFRLMQAAGVVPTEHVHANTFWKQVGDILKPSADDSKPCECVI